MKTTDLIPLILLELNDSDKYGFELTKSIESKSQGKIVIKQPTLYTVLKKLEKSKFISSYWEDSDIGGKRHYYKITDNGRLQVSTLPDFSTLINNALADGQENLNDSISVENNSETNNEIQPEVKTETIIDEKPIVEEKVEEKSNFSIMDMIFENSTNETLEKDEIDNTTQTDLDITFVEENEKISLSPELKENIIPTSEVFAENNIDNLTDTEINESNLDVLKTESTSDKFASNNNVATFTEKQPTLTKEYKEEIKTKSLESLIVKDGSIKTTGFNYQDVKYVDYTNFTTDEKHVKAKVITNKLSMSVCLTSLYLLIMTLLSTLCVKFSGTSPLFYITIIISCISLIFYPSLFFAKKEKIRLKLVKNKYKPDFKKEIIISISIVLAILITCFIVNISVGNYNILKMFSASNFENIYAEILVSSTLFINILIKYLLTKKYISLE